MNRLISMDEVIADLFIYAWENEIDEQIVFWTFAGMNENPYAAAELEKRLREIV